MADICFRVLYLHGFDNAPYSGVGAALAQALGPEFVVEEPAGPIVLSSGGRAWWDEEFDSEDWDRLRQQLDGADAEDENGDGNRVGQHRVGQHRVGQHRNLPTLLCGFSQGSGAALAWLTHPHRSTSVQYGVLVSPFLVDIIDQHLRSHDSSLPSVGPLHFVTFDADEVVDPMHSSTAARLLRTRSIQVETVELNGGHAITERTIQEMAELLRAATVAPSP